MGKRGPKPKLASIEKLEGNPGKGTIDVIGLEATGEAFAPKHLHDDAQACIGDGQAVDAAENLRCL